MLLCVPGVTASVVYALSLHDALPICVGDCVSPEAQVALLDELDRAAAHFRDVAIVKRRCDSTAHWVNTGYRFGLDPKRSEEHTSELQSHVNLVCRLLLEIKIDSGSPL